MFKWFTDITVNRGYRQENFKPKFFVIVTTSFRTIKILVILSDLFTVNCQYRIIWELVPNQLEGQIFEKSLFWGPNLKPFLKIKSNFVQKTDISETFQGPHWRASRAAGWPWLLYEINFVPNKVSHYRNISNSNIVRDIDGLSFLICLSF